MSITVEATHHSFVSTTPVVYQNDEGLVQRGLFENSIVEVEDNFVDQIE